MHGIAGRILTERYTTVLNAIDAVAWGTVTNGLPEGAAAVAPTNMQTLARLPNGVDTNSNVVDFQVTGTPTPKASN